MLTVEQQRARAAEARRLADNERYQQLAARAERVKRAGLHADLVAAAGEFMAAEAARERTTQRAAWVHEGKLRRADAELTGWRERADAKIQRCRRCYTPHNGAHRCTQASRIAALDEWEMAS